MPDTPQRDGDVQAETRTARAEHPTRRSSGREAEQSLRSRLRALLTGIGRWCARPRSAMILALLLAGMSIIGSFFPQLPTGLQETQRTMWLETAKSRYGRATAALQALGAFTFARAPLYLGTTGLLVAATLICITRRWRGLWRVIHDVSIIHRSRPGTLASSYQLSASIAPDHAMEDLGRALTKARYRVRTQGGGELGYLRADRRPWARMGTLATHLAIPLAVSGMLVSALFATRFQVALAPGQLAPLAPTTDVLLRNDGFELTEDSQGIPTSFQAQVTLVKDGLETGTHTLLVNRPLMAQGYLVFLDNYWSAPEGNGVSLIVARDPGYAPFVAGALLFTLGTMLALWFDPSTLWITLKGRRAVVHFSGRESARRQANAIIRTAGLDLGQDVSSHSTEGIYD